MFNDTKKYSDKKIDDDKAKTLLSKLNTLMLEEKLYANANLKSSDIAKKMQLSVHQISQLLNDNLGKNFSRFINEYRIEESKKMLQTNTNLTLEAIGYECGFNSKSTFFTTFKKITGTTPAAYREQL